MSILSILRRKYLEAQLRESEKNYRRLATGEFGLLVRLFGYGTISKRKAMDKEYKRILEIRRELNKLQ